MKFDIVSKEIVMYAVIEDSGTQFKVEKNDEILIDLRDSAEVGSDIVFKNVVSVGADGKMITGDALSKYSVNAKVIDNVKGKKIVVGKFKRRKNMRCRTGHRQHYIRVKITEIAG